MAEFNKATGSVSKPGDPSTSSTMNILQDGAKRKFDDVVSNAGDVAKAATTAVSDVRDDLREAIEEIVYKRPFTSLCMTLALGFVVGALWRK